MENLTENMKLKKELTERSRTARCNIRNLEHIKWEEYSISKLQYKSIENSLKYQIGTWKAIGKQNQS
jgi:hypothetical protein